jgi:hypothetical protein
LCCIKQGKLIVKLDNFKKNKLFFYFILYFT